MPKATKAKAIDLGLDAKAVEWLEHRDIPLHDADGIVDKASRLGSTILRVTP